MSIMTLYVYNIDSGNFVYEYLGSIANILHDLGAEMDFTLKPPPDSDNIWRWVVDEWVLDTP